MERKRAILLLNIAGNAEVTLELYQEILRRRFPILKKSDPLSEYYDIPHDRDIGDQKHALSKSFRIIRDLG